MDGRQILEVTSWGGRDLGAEYVQNKQNTPHISTSMME